MIIIIIMIQNEVSFWNKNCLKREEVVVFLEIKFLQVIEKSQDNIRDIFRNIYDRTFFAKIVTQKSSIMHVWQGLK